MCKSRAETRGGGQFQAVRFGVVEAGKEKKHGRCQSVEGNPHDLTELFLTIPGDKRLPSAAEDGLDTDEPDCLGN
ncbi:hypothetical protein [Zavarzinella formosa]|uniref:hypothetical protein n=1 Tax=Zavarzinella formosa TaxID=360055 RepID=UPI000376B9FA|nr:hypothetical protein [Zavarzinella formosa]